VKELGLRVCGVTFSKKRIIYGWFRTFDIQYVDEAMACIFERQDAFCVRN